MFFPQKIPYCRGYSISCLILKSFYHLFNDCIVFHCMVAIIDLTSPFVDHLSYKLWLMLQWIIFKERLFTHVYLCRIIFLEIEFLCQNLCGFMILIKFAKLSSLKVEPVYSSQNNMMSLFSIFHQDTVLLKFYICHSGTWKTASCWSFNLHFLVHEWDWTSF